MGILNITPDSFSDGGLYLDSKQAVLHAKELLSHGAQIIDIGGESTGPGSQAVPASEELERVRKPVETLVESAIISVDTYKAAVAKIAIDSGAQIINDVSALRADPAMAALIASTQAYIVLMYSKEPGCSPHAKPTNFRYQDIIATISEFFEKQLDFATTSGIQPKQIILDPGMGQFISADPNYSWELLSRLDELAKKFDFPFLVGTSRKSFLKTKLPVTHSLEELDQLSEQTAKLAIQKGAKIIRLHNLGGILDKATS